MRPEGNNPLDLNNFPDDQYSRDGKQVLEDTSSPGGCSGSRKKKSGGKDGKDVDCGKVYECRFCSLKFCKSQALGGHMNRHRQERETETLNHARQLVFRNDHTVVAAQGPPHLGCCPPIASAAGYPNHPAAVAAAGNMVGDPTVQLPPLRFSRYFSSSSGSSSSTHMPPPPPPQPYLYTSPPRPMSFPTHLIPQQHPMMNDNYHVGHVMTMSSSHPNYGHHNMNYAAGGETNYTCIGAPVGQGFMGSGGGGGGKDGSLQQQNQDEGLNWGRNYPSGAQHRLDPPSAINRFQDGF